MLRFIDNAIATADRGIFASQATSPRARLIVPELPVPCEVTSRIQRRTFPIPIPFFFSSVFAYSLRETLQMTLTRYLIPRSLSRLTVVYSKIEICLLRFGPLPLFFFLKAIPLDAS